MAVPSDLALLSRVQRIDLSHNARLFGTIPPRVGRLSTLQALDLSSCARECALRCLPPRDADVCALRAAVTGTLPSELGDLLNLRVLNVLNNPGLDGTVPAEHALRTQETVLGQASDTSQELRTLHERAGHRSMERGPTCTTANRPAT